MKMNPSSSSFILPAQHFVRYKIRIDEGREKVTPLREITEIQNEENKPIGPHFRY